MRKRWKAALDGKTDSVRIGADNGISVEETVNAIKMEPVIYTKTGEAFKSESGTNISASEGMTEAVNKFIPIFVGLLLILCGLLWIVNGKNGNKRSCFFGMAAIVVGIMMFVTVFFRFCKAGHRFRKL